MNTTLVKQQQKVGFFIFKFTRKFMLDSVYINKIHAPEFLYIISLYYYREGFFPCFQFQKNPSRLISKQLGRKGFSMEQLTIDPGPLRRLPTIVWQNSCINK